ncbi:hypothetical protein M514_04863 [Trichuris suis]|uniref:Uncharacterized protein n=1 Tax=Trichuris suis TaxID=68888 RepID=A0A085MAS5_9BILA|nr:hypothetical protein M513_04863 [Trichuris suis]KFD73120.1 hypothetical protein M514_04863 [Trichuris suis]
MSSTNTSRHKAAAAAAQRRQQRTLKRHDKRYRKRPMLQRDDRAYTVVLRDGRCIVEQSCLMRRCRLLATIEPLGRQRRLSATVVVKKEMSQTDNTSSRRGAKLRRRRRRLKRTAAVAPDGRRAVVDQMGQSEDTHAQLKNAV